MNDLISADNLTVLRAGRTILKSVSLTVGERDFVTVIGPNGAGKTTLLRYLMGFHRPDNGSVWRRRSLRIGYMPQRAVPAWTLPMNGRRFLTLNGGNRDISGTVEETGVGALLNRPLYALSAGEWQRLLLARALLNRPELLILDEPLQNLDISGQSAFYRLLESIYNEHQISILMVSHDLHLVMRGTQRVVCLYHHICCSGAPQTIAQDPEFIALFGDDMARLTAVYHHNHDHSHASLPPPKIDHDAR